MQPGIGGPFIVAKIERVARTLERASGIAGSRTSRYAVYAALPLPAQVVAEDRIPAFTLSTRVYLQPRPLPNSVCVTALSFD